MTLPTILHRDANCIVIDKPAGLAVHPGPRTPESLEDLLPDLARAVGERKPLSPAHRLDRDTSGCLALARGPAAARALGAAFAAGEVRKTYWALVDGPVRGGEGVIEAPLLKVSTREKGWRMLADPRGKPARTRWRALRALDGGLLIEFTPETGRTHQLRAHATLLGDGCAIRGDPVYGAPGGARTLLHARSLALPTLRGAPAFEAIAPAPSWVG